LTSGNIRLYPAHRAQGVGASAMAEMHQAGVWGDVKTGGAHAITPKGQRNWWIERLSDKLTAQPTNAKQFSAPIRHACARAPQTRGSKLRAGRITRRGG